MLSREATDAVLSQCSKWAKWKPIQPGTMLAIAMHDEGTIGGVFVPEYRARHKYQALVLATCECRWIKESDVVCFDIGVGEELNTVNGQTFVWLAEKNLGGLDEAFWQSRAPQQTASGLWTA